MVPPLRLFARAIPKSRGLILRVPSRFASFFQLCGSEPNFDPAFQQGNGSGQSALRADIRFQVSREFMVGGAGQPVRDHCRFECDNRRA